MANDRNDFPPSVNVGKLYERTSAQVIEALAAL